MFVKRKKHLKNYLQYPSEIREAGRDRAFTMIELVITVAVIGIIAVGAIPYAQKYLDKYRVYSDAQTLAGKIRLVQQEAVTKQAASLRALFIPYNAQDSYSNAYRLFLNPDDGEEYVNYPLGEGVFMTDEVTFPGNWLSYDAKGAPNVGGHLLLTDNNGHDYYVIVLPVTGQVRVSETAP